MKLSAPKTLAEAIFPLLLTTWIFGVGVIEYPMGRLRRITSALFSLVNFLIYLNFVRIVNLSKLLELQESKLGADNYRMAVHAYAAIAVTSMCLAQIRAKALQETFPVIIGLNDRLSKLGVPKDYKSFFNEQIIHLGVAFASISVLMALSLNYADFDLPSGCSRIGFLMSAHHPSMLFFIVDSLFSGSLRYLRNRFERLNRLLGGLDSLERNETTAYTHESDDQFPRDISLVEEVRRNNLLAIRAADQLWLLHVVRETRRIHRGLCKVAMAMNRAFGVQLLLSVALSFGMTTAMLFASYTYASAQLSSNNNSDGSNWINGFILVTWITLYSIKVIMIVDACAATSCEANRTGGLISKLLDSAVGDKVIRNEISIFSLQLIQNPLSFTASGFFTLNYSLIRKMIGTVTTYFVIMIQMRSIYDTNAVNSTANSTILVDQENDVV